MRFRQFLVLGMILAGAVLVQAIVALQTRLDYYALERRYEADKTIMIAGNWLDQTRGDFVAARITCEPAKHLCIEQGQMIKADGLKPTRRPVPAIRYVIRKDTAAQLAAENTTGLRLVIDKASGRIRKIDHKRTYHLVGRMAIRAHYSEMMWKSLGSGGRSLFLTLEKLKAMQR